MKIYQTYYKEEHKKELIPNLIHTDTRGWDIPLLEYDIFRKLRPEGDFGMVSWAFTRKSWLEDWEDTAREKLKEYDAVIINPFPAVSAMSYTPWDSHPKIKKWAQVDTDIPMLDMAFCSYIIAKKCWWDKYFEFMEQRLANIHKDALKVEGYWRNNNLNSLPFLIERWLNYTLDGAWIWEYDEAHHNLKFGHTDFYKMKNCKFTPEWKLLRDKHDFLDVCHKDDIPWR